MLDMPVKFGGVSIGATTAKLAVSFARSNISLESADDAFCERRLIGRVVLGHAEDAAGQTKYAKTDHTIDGAFDVKGYSVKVQSINAGLTFGLSEIDVAELALFANRPGRVIVEDMQSIPVPVKEEFEDDDEDGPSLFVADDTEWKQVNLDQLFDAKKATRKLLHEAGIETLGDLVGFQQNRQLTDIKGIGPSKIEEIEFQTTKFWEDNPDLNRD